MGVKVNNVVEFIIDENTVEGPGERIMEHHWKVNSLSKLSDAYSPDNISKPVWREHCH